MDVLAHPWWEKQPGETHTGFARFSQYLNTPKHERSYRKVAESAGKTLSTIETQAKAQRWRDRAAAWDSHWEAEQAYALAERVKDQAEKLSEAHINAATELLYAVRKSARYVIDNQVILDPGDAARWADVSIKLAKAAKETPDQVVQFQHTGHDGGPIQVDIPELDNLSPQEQQERVTEMLSGVARLDQYRKYGDTA